MPPRLIDGVVECSTKRTGRRSSSSAWRECAAQRGNAKAKRLLPGRRFFRVSLHSGLLGSSRGQELLEPDRRVAFRSRRARRARRGSRGLAGFRSGAGRERGTCRGWRFDRIGIASVGPRRAKQPILALHEHLPLASGLAVALGKVDGHLQGFPFGWIRTRVAIAGANFPFALALGDGILGTGHRDLPAGDERGRDAATTPAAPNRSSGKQNRPPEIPGSAPDRFLLKLARSLLAKPVMTVCMPIRSGSIRPTR